MIQESICCPVSYGAFKRTTFPKKYIHVLCALWNTSVEPTKTGYTVEKWLLNKQASLFTFDTLGLEKEFFMIYRNVIYAKNVMGWLLNVNHKDVQSEFFDIFK